MDYDPLASQCDTYECDTYDLRTFGLKEMIHAGRLLRKVDPQADCMERAAGGVVDFFYDRFRGPDDQPACVLARCFKTHRLGSLPLPLRQQVSNGRNGAPHSPETRCLTLLASRGKRAEWNRREGSAGHQAIPLATVAMMEQAPMILQLVLQLGLTPEDVVRPALRLHERRQTFDVFHVPEARGSSVVPAQDSFVVPHGVVSVLGFGGLLPTDELFAVILFTRVPLYAETAALFRTLALSVKLHLLPFSGKRVFAEATVASEVFAL